MGEIVCMNKASAEKTAKFWKDDGYPVKIKKEKGFRGSALYIIQIGKKK